MSYLDEEDEEKKRSFLESPENPDLSGQPNNPQYATPMDDPRTAKIMDWIKENREMRDVDATKEANDARKRQMYAGIGEGVDQALYSNAVAHGATPQSGKFYDKLADDGGSLKNARALQEDARRSELKNYLGMQRMSKVAGEKPINPKDATGSDSAKGMADSIKAMYPKASSKYDLDGKSYNELKDLSTAIGRIENKKEESSSVKLRRINYIDKIQDNMISPKEPNMQRIKRGIVSGKTLMALFDKYPNLDDMVDIDVTLAVAELGKLVTGGEGSDKARESQTARTAISDINKFLQYVNGKPTPLELGAFLRKKKEYVVDLLDLYKGELYEHQGQNLRRLDKLNLSEEEFRPFIEGFPHLFPSKADKKSTEPKKVDPKYKGDTVKQGGKTYNWDPSTTDYIEVK